MRRTLKKKTLVDSQENWINLKSSVPGCFPRQVFWQRIFEIISTLFVVNSDKDLIATNEFLSLRVTTHEIVTLFLGSSRICRSFFLEHPENKLFEVFLFSKIESLSGEKMTEERTKEKNLRLFNFFSLAQAKLFKVSLLLLLDRLKLNWKWRKKKVYELKLYF